MIITIIFPFDFTQGNNFFKLENIFFFFFFFQTVKIVSRNAGTVFKERFTFVQKEIRFTWWLYIEKVWAYGLFNLYRKRKCLRTFWRRQCDSDSFFFRWNNIRCVYRFPPFFFIHVVIIIVMIITLKIVFNRRSCASCEQQKQS